MNHAFGFQITQTFLLNGTSHPTSFLWAREKWNPLACYIDFNHSDKRSFWRCSNAHTDIEAYVRSTKTLTRCDRFCDTLLIIVVWMFFVFFENFKLNLIDVHSYKPTSIYSIYTAFVFTDVPEAQVVLFKSPRLVLQAKEIAVDFFSYFEAWLQTDLKTTAF